MQNIVHRVDCSSDALWPGHHNHKMTTQTHTTKQLQHNHFHTGSHEKFWLPHTRGYPSVCNGMKDEANPVMSEQVQILSMHLCQQ
jgi:hypothetical protein